MYGGYSTVSIALTAVECQLPTACVGPTHNGLRCSVPLSLYPSAPFALFCTPMGSPSPVFGACTLPPLPLR